LKKLAAKPQPSLQKLTCRLGLARNATRHRVWGWGSPERHETPRLGLGLARTPRDTRVWGWGPKRYETAAPNAMRQTQLGAATLEWQK